MSQWDALERSRAEVGEWCDCFWEMEREKSFNIGITRTTTGASGRRKTTILCGGVS